METVYTKNIIEFVTVALEYCAYLEQCESKRFQDFVPVMQKVLSLLYLKAAIVEKPVPLGDMDVPQSVTEADYNAIEKKVADLMGEYDCYFDGDEASSVSENLADIYQELKDFIMNYKKGDQAVSNDSLYSCLDTFENYWGLRLLNCVKALHNIAYSIKPDDDDIQGDDNQGGN